MLKIKTNKPAEAKAPSLIAYQVCEVSEDKKFWTRIGAAWAHNDGNGFTIKLEAMPFDGSIVLRSESETKD